MNSAKLATKLLKQINLIPINPSLHVHDSFGSYLYQQDSCQTQRKSYTWKITGPFQLTFSNQNNSDGLYLHFKHIPSMRVVYFSNTAKFSPHFMSATGNGMSSSNEVIIFWKLKQCDDINDSVSHYWECWLILEDEIIIKLNLTFNFTYTSSDFKHTPYTDNKILLNFINLVLKDWI